MTLIAVSKLQPDARVIALCETAAGIARGDYLVRVNNRKVLNGVLEAARVQPEQAADVLRQIDKFDKVGEAGVRELLTARFGHDELRAAADGGPPDLDRALHYTAFWGLDGIERVDAPATLTGSGDASRIAAAAPRVDRLTAASSASGSRTLSVHGGLIQFSGL